MVLTRKVELTKELILSHVSEYDIVRAFWPGGKELKLNTGIISPFRSEDDPSFIIGTKYGNITYKDLGDFNFRGDVWNFVRQIENLQSFPQVLARIDQMFNLGYSIKKIETRSPIITWKQPEIEIKKPTFLQVTVRKFNKEELAYWNLYHQDISDLKREDIYAAKDIWRNRKKIDQKQLTFCYYCADIAKWKIYRPLAEKRTKTTPPSDWKWDNSINSLTYIENIDKMHGEIGICTKSRKDRMVIRKATGIEAICSVQAEDPSAVTDEDLYKIWSQCQKKYIVADADKKGKEFSWWMCKEHGYLHCNTPDNLLDLNINDFADMGRYMGIEAVTKHFKKKKIIQ